MTQRGPRRLPGLATFSVAAHATTAAVALTDYEKYIRTEELLSLQKSAEQVICPDELQFQIVHQASELWMKLVAHELGQFVGFVGDGGPDALAMAQRALTRVAMMQRILLSQVDVLDTLTPVDYMTIRTVLGRGSGQESPGFKTMLRLPGETVWPAFAALIERRGVTLRQIYEGQAAHAQLHALCEGLVDYDQLLQTWRQRHLMLVYRIIGTGTPSLKGKPSELLAHGMKTRFFPALWDVRDEIFAAWTAQMAAKGREHGYHG